jgi:hypothetical protein
VLGRGILHLILGRLGISLQLIGNILELLAVTALAFIQFCDEGTQKLAVLRRQQTAELTVKFFQITIVLGCLHPGWLHIIHR